MCFTEPGIYHFSPRTPATGQVEKIFQISPDGQGQTQIPVQPESMSASQMVLRACSWVGFTFELGWLCLRRTNW